MEKLIIIPLKEHLDILEENKKLVEELNKKDSIQLRREIYFDKWGEHSNYYVITKEDYIIKVTKLYNEVIEENSILRNNLLRTQNQLTLKNKKKWYQFLK